jgi:O-antigen/teichoic acid export membrane protein
MARCVRTAALNLVPRRFGQYVLAAADQALFSFANFVANVSLARTISPAEYGMFAVAQSVLFFIIGFQNALFIEPMNMLGPQKYSTKQESYFGTLFSLNVVFGVVSGLALLLAGAVFPVANIRPILNALAVAAPFILQVWLLRRFYYVSGRVQISVLQSGAYGLCSLGGLWIVPHVAKLTAASALFVLAASAVAACSPAICTLLFRQPEIVGPKPRLRAILQQHWRFGRWVAAGNVLSTVAAQGQILVAAALGGYGTAGTVRALSNLTMPTLQLLNGVSGVVVPIMARHIAKKDSKAAVSLCWRFTWLSFGCTVFAGVLMCVCRNSLVALVCGPAYRRDAYLLPLLALSPIATSVGIGLPLLFRATNRPRYLLINTAVTAGTSLASAAILIPRLGALGVVTSMVAIAVANTASSFVLQYGIFQRFKAPQLLTHAG